MKLFPSTRPRPFPLPDHNPLPMDDDIQFLGMVPPISPHKPSYPLASHPPMHPPASGIMLVIPKSGDEPTQTLRFLKSRSPVVHIGRASSSHLDTDKSSDSILFRCPVISRRHAKLMFSSGQVYIVDLHSHHGTHLRRRDEIVRPIVPDVPITLQDGDTLIFGKAVGKEPFCVSPVIANIMLIYDTEAVQSPIISQPVISLVDSPTLPATPIKSKDQAEVTNFGRYGLFGPHSSPSSQESSPGSSDEDFSQSDPDGDEDDDEDDDFLDPPEDHPSVPFGGHAQAQSTGACYDSLPSLHGLGLLASRHVMHHAPPTHIPLHAPLTLSNTHSQMTSSLTPERRSFVDPWLFDCNQRANIQDSSSVAVEIGADESMDISRPTSPPLMNVLPHVPEVNEEALASVAQTESPIKANAGEPLIVGAYPGSPVPSAVVSPWEDGEVSSQLDQQRLQQSLIQPQRRPENLPCAAEGTASSSLIVEASESSEQLAEDVASDVDADGDADVDPIPTTGTNTGGQAAPLEQAPLATAPVAVVSQPYNSHVPAGIGAATGSGITIDARLTSLDEALVNLWGNVLRMQIAHRKTQTDHKILSDRTDALAARVDAVQADLRGALCNDDEVDTLRTRVKAAEDLLAELQGRLSATEDALARAKVQAEEQAAELAARVVANEVS
ncbi:hypothetical protein F5148DRAFT_1214961 [Russula earlei]|uniref:Uncharacterized protein n=1 Tax=Russula earlei TaxID=71964 RepID=A0ACC0U3N2_9AGAM|nr:hypothetical protein F5148DRAFT_1214961 [Russula earlei]